MKKNKEEIAKGKEIELQIEEEIEEEQRIQAKKKK